jgi:hypothetical protein
MRRLARMIVAAATATVARLVPVAGQAGGASSIACNPSSNNFGTIDSGLWVYRRAELGGDSQQGEVS